MSMWLIVFLRLCVCAEPIAPGKVPLAIEFFRTRPPETEAPPTLSRRPDRGRDEVAPVMCSFCWWRRSKSRRAKHRVHSGHSKGFSLVCERSCRLRCSNRANDRPQVPHTCGRGLSVLGGGKCAFDEVFCAAELFSLDVVDSVAH